MSVSSRLLRPTAAPPPAPADPSRRCRRLYSIPRSFDAGTPFFASLIVTARQPQGIVVAATSWSGPEGGPQAEERTYRDAPTSIELEPIVSEEQFDRIVAEAQQLEESLVVLWMANWCRKCIYLKPKLEKLAADYYPSIRFYCVDVNTVPQRLVNRAGITKMPTIQLWKDSQKQAQVIGGHKAWLVVDDVRRMIESED